MITNCGADMINDISAGAIDPNMIPVIAQLNVPYIIMHMKGIPGNMQQNPNMIILLMRSFNSSPRR